MIPIEVQRRKAHIIMTIATLLIIAQACAVNTTVFQGWWFRIPIKLLSII